MVQGGWQRPLFAYCWEVNGPRGLSLFKTMDNHATAADFADWAERAKGMTVAGLLYTVKDCYQAAQAMRGWNPVKEGFYMDQASTYGVELSRRRAA